MPTQIDISDLSLPEGTGSGTTNFVFFVQRSGDTTAASTFTYAFANVSTNAADFVGGLPAGGTITFAAGETAKTISVPVSRDYDVEGSETFTVTLSNPVGATFGQSVATGTIQEDDSAGPVRISNVSIVEGNSGTTNAIVTLTRISGNTPFTATYSTADGTATTAGADYTATTGTVTFAGGQSTATISVPIIGDTNGEPDETFTVNVTGATNGVTLQNPDGTTAATVTGTVTITNDDSSYSIATPAAIAEGSSASGATILAFTVTRVGATAAAATVNYAVTNITTDASDFNGAISGVATFAAGSSTATINVPISSDFNVEPNETFTVTISSPSTGIITTATATGTINNDDSAGTVAASPAAVTVVEGADGNVTANVTLVRTGGTGAPFSVNVSTQDISANAGTDYTAISNQTVNFAVGQNSVIVPITILRDFTVENDETFLLNLSAPTNGATAGQNAQITIQDNPIPTYAGTVSVANGSYLEGNSSNTVIVNVTRSGGGAAFSVNYATVAGSALAGSDYIAQSGTVSFAQGQNTAPISITIVGDFVVEPDETFSIQLSAPTNGVSIASSGTVTIVNDDSASNGTVVNGNQLYVTQSTILAADAPYIVLSTQVNSGTDPINLTGNGLAQTIVGNYGVNVLTGGGGADTLIGLLGDDTYVVSNSGTVIQENAGEGNDTVVTSVDLVLPTNASVEFFSAQDAASTAPINLQGSTASQIITGNAGNNIINGFGGNDTMIGLGGNDTYLVRGPGDVVIEANGGGFDTVYTTVSYNLGSNEIEVLSTVTQSDTTPINLIGNFVSQYVVGNYGDNLLNGGSGADTLIGLRGNDLYAVGDSRIIIVEADGEGNDTVVSSVDYQLGAGVSVEVLSAQDRTATTTLNLRGNEFNQTVVGNDGNNTIDGGAGSDYLIGGGGSDRFAFTTALGPTNADTIADFQVGVDRIGLASNIFAAVGTSVTAAGFTIGTAATTVDQHIIYNQTTGQIYYDADGSGAGAAVLFAVVTAGTALTATSFEVIPPVTTV